MILQCIITFICCTLLNCTYAPRPEVLDDIRMKACEAFRENQNRRNQVFEICRFIQSIDLLSIEHLPNESIAKQLDLLLSYIDDARSIAKSESTSNLQQKKYI